MLKPELKNVAHFSLDPALLREILDHAKPLGHNEEPETLHLGFGFLYYGLVRALRPRHVLVIGSGFGFSVTCLALGLRDNGRGSLSFVDPSYSVFKHGLMRTVGGTGQWSDPQKVRARFDRLSRSGRDFLMALLAREGYRGTLPEIRQTRVEARRCTRTPRPRGHGLWR